MTVATTTARNDYISSGITGPYAFTFPIQSASHLVVTKRDQTTGSETTLTQGVDYTLAGTAWANGGSFTLTASLAAGYALTARRVVPLTQLVDLRNQGSFLAEVHESEFDLLTQADQQQQDQIDRCLKLTTTEVGTSLNTVLPPVSQRANKNLSFDASGNLAVATATVSSIPDVSLMQVVDTIAALKALAIPSGSVQYFVRGYYTASDGGGGIFRWNASDTTADNLGTVIIPNSAPGTGRWNRIVSLADGMDVRWFGAKGDGVTDDYASIVAAYNALAYTSINQAGNGGYAYQGFQQRLVLPKAHYLISQSLVLSNVYIDIDGGGSILAPTAGFTLSNFALDFTTIYNASVKDLKLIKFTNHIRMYNPNLDQGKIEFDNVQLNGGDLGYDLDCRSSFVKITNFRYDNVKKIALIRNGDRVQFSRGWMSAGALAANYDGMFTLDSTTGPGLELIDVFYVPTPQSVTGGAVVKVVKEARVTIDRCLFGGEPGQIPLIANYADASNHYARGSVFTITNTMAFTGNTVSGPMILLYAIPNTISLTNVNGLVDETHVYGLIRYDTTFRTFAAAKAALPADSYPKFYFNGEQPVGFNGFSTNELGQLDQYVASRNKISYGYISGVTNVTYGVITELSVGALLRGQTYKVCITCQSNPGADRYGEFIVAGDYNGTTPTIATILAGASTVAARLSVVAGAIKVLTNGSVSAIDYRYTVERLCTFIEAYP